MACHLTGLLLLLTVLASVPAFSSGNPTSGISFKGSKRFALAYTINQVSEIKSENINDFDRADGYSAALEMGMPFSVFAFVNYFQNRDVKVKWKDSPDTPVEFYGYLVDLGVKATLPLGFFQPWIGAGYSWGVLTFSNPDDREVDNFMIAIYSRGSRNVIAPMGVGGVDISMGTAGLRFAYSARQLTTKKSSLIGDEPYDMTMGNVWLGFWVNH